MFLWVYPYTSAKRTRPSFTDPPTRSKRALDLLSVVLSAPRSSSFQGCVSNSFANCATRTNHFQSNPVAHTHKQPSFFSCIFMNKQASSTQDFSFLDSRVWREEKLFFFSPISFFFFVINYMERLDFSVFPQSVSSVSWPPTCLSLLLLLLLLAMGHDMLQEFMVISVRSSADALTRPHICYLRGKGRFNLLFIEATLSKMGIAHRTPVQWMRTEISLEEASISGIPLNGNVLFWRAVCLIRTCNWFFFATNGESNTNFLMSNLKTS